MKTETRKPNVVSRQDKNYVYTDERQFNIAVMTISVCVIIKILSFSATLSLLYPSCNYCCSVAPSYRTSFINRSATMQSTVFLPNFVIIGTFFCSSYPFSSIRMASLLITMSFVEHLLILLTNFISVVWSFCYLVILLFTAQLHVTKLTQ